MSSFKKLENCEIIRVKFYQAVKLGNVSVVTSVDSNEVVSVQKPKIVTIERGEFSVLITEVDPSKKETVYTEIPFNNVAYINYGLEVKAAPAAKDKK